MGELKNLLHRNDDVETGGIVEIAKPFFEASYTKTYLDALIQLGPPVTHTCSRGDGKRSYMSSYESSWW